MGVSKQILQLISHERFHWNFGENYRFLGDQLVIKWYTSAWIRDISQIGKKGNVRAWIVSRCLSCLQWRLIM